MHALQRGSWCGGSLSPKVRFFSLQHLAIHCLLTFPPSEDKTFERSADPGDILGDIFVKSIKSIISTNDALMNGNLVQGLNIQSYLANGSFVNFQTVIGVNDKSQVINKMNAFFLGNALPR